MVDPATPLITKEVVKIPYNENVYLKAEARQATIAAYKISVQQLFFANAKP